MLDDEGEMGVLIFSCRLLSSFNVARANWERSRRSSLLS